MPSFLTLHGSAGYTCQQYQMYGRYKHCIICDMPVKKDEQKVKQEEGGGDAGSDEGKGKEKVDQDILDDAAAFLNIEAPSDLSISGHMAVELADAQLPGAEEPPSGEEVAPGTVEPKPDEGDQPAKAEQEQRREEEEAKADEQACDNGSEEEQQKAEKVEKGKEKAGDDDDEGEVVKKPEHEIGAEVHPAKEASDVLCASNDNSSSDESVGSEIGAEGLLAANFPPEEVKGKRGKKKARRHLKRSRLSPLPFPSFELSPSPCLWALRHSDMFHFAP